MSWNHTDGALLKIGTTNMPVPTKYDVTYQDLSSSEAGRDMDGNMFKSKIDPNGTARTIDLEWRNTSKANGELILSALGTDEYLKCSFYDPFSGSTVSNRWMYAGDRKASIIMMKKSGSNNTVFNPVYTITCTLIEKDPVNNSAPS